MEAINEFFTSFSSFLWGWPMIILLLGTHIFDGSPALSTA